MREEWEKWEEGERGMRDRWVGEVVAEGETDREGGSNGVKIGHYGSACDSSFSHKHKH